MREIKFRVLDKKLNRISYNFHFYKFNYVNNQFGNNDFIFMQYTGLKDQNEVEIYEGDILEQHLKYDNNIATHIIYWNENEACFKAKGIKDSEGIDCNIYDWWLKEKVVIGNIYENKELINIRKFNLNNINRPRREDKPWLEDKRYCLCCDTKFKDCIHSVTKKGINFCKLFGLILEGLE